VTHPGSRGAADEPAAARARDTASVLAALRPLLGALVSSIGSGPLQVKDGRLSRQKSSRVPADCATPSEVAGVCEVAPRQRPA